MAAVETGQSRSAGKAAKKHKKKRRLAVRIDMTPMVDVAFLLLTFFMLTTVFSKPQTMEINLPPEETTVEVAESNLLTLRILANGNIVESGYGNAAAGGVRQTARLDAGAHAANPKLITLIKVDREGTYK
jgi:biopolymer transport protein ExbD